MLKTIEVYYLLRSRWLAQLGSFVPCDVDCCCHQLGSTGLNWAFTSKVAHSHHWQLGGRWPRAVSRSISDNLHVASPHMAWASLNIAGFQKVASASCQSSSGLGSEVPEQRLGHFPLVKASPAFRWGQMNSTSWYEK